MRRRQLCVAALLAFLATPARADCVVGASLAMNFIVINPNTIMLRLGSSGGIVIKTFSFIYPSSSVTVLKDSFCDFESGVLIVNGEVVDAQQVKRVR